MISIVDDDQSVRNAARTLLRSHGYATATFASAEEFLQSDRVQDTACLITDVQMPAMTGYELHRRLVDTHRAIPTILVTGFPNDVDRARALNDGVVCYLRKPVDIEHLTRCVRDALKSVGSDEGNS
jgi:FixJ family two-component response regulator